MQSKESNLNEVLVVTGGLGFIGKNFLKYIDEFYSKIIVIDKVSTHSDLSFYNSISSHKFTLIKSDISETHNYATDLPENFDLLNFAAESHVDRSFINSVDFSLSNYISTHKMLEYLRLKKIKPRIIHISTDEVYGSVMDEASDEEGKFNPTNPYSVSKAAADMLCQTYRQCYGFNILIVRPNNIYGPYQHCEKLIPAAVLAASGHSRLEIHGNGEQLRSFLHIDDLSKALHLLLKQNWSCLKNYTYNIASSNEYTVNQIIGHIANLAGKDIEDFAYYSSDRPFNDLRYNTISQKIESLGWSEEANFEEKLAEIYKEIQVFQ